MKYPETKRQEVTDNLHGEKIPDHYRWLEDLEADEVQQWLNKQNNFTKEILDQIPERPEAIAEIKSYLSLADFSIPIQKKKYFYYKKRTTENQSILYRQKNGTKQVEVLIDPNELGKENPIALDWFHISPNERYIAYGLSENGDEWSTLYVLDLETKKILSEEIPRTRFCRLVWSQDESGFYYTRFPEAGTVPAGQENYNEKVFYHKLGDDWKKDSKIFQKEGRTNRYMFSLSQDERYLAVVVFNYTESDIFVLDLQDNKELIAIEGEDGLTTATIQGNNLWLLTNLNAPKKAVYKVPLESPAKKNWKLIIPESEGVISKLVVTKNRLTIKEMINVKDQLKIFDHSGKLLATKKMPSYGKISLGPGGGGIASTAEKVLYFLSESFLSHTEVYKLDLESLEVAKFMSTKQPLDPKEFETKQVWYKSKDGTKVSMFIAHRKNLQLNGKNPTMLCGYGGFNIAIQPPYLKPSRFYWLKKGGIIAIANLRGGSEFGEEWHKDGMLDKKQNVFDDFIWAAKWLIKKKYASAKTLSAYGRSNGGLLTGAAVTQKPELFNAVYVGVPLLDMIRYQLFRIAKYWIPEYGSSDDKEQFNYLYAYSPYHRVKRGISYPATFYVAAESDGRVDPCHAMKMAAKMQWATSGEEPILLFVEKQAGHGVGKPLEQLAETEADLYTFLGWKTGLLE